MLAKVQASKAGSRDIEAKLAKLTGVARHTKERNSKQNHQRDWLRAHAELQKQRTEAEAARSLWLQAESELPAAEAAGAPLRDLVRDDASADAIRREWSFEMRSQIRDLRELCTTAGAHNCLLYTSPSPRDS